MSGAELEKPEKASPASVTPGDEQHDGPAEQGEGGRHALGDEDPEHDHHHDEGDDGVGGQRRGIMPARRGTRGPPMAVILGAGDDRPIGFPRSRRAWGSSNVLSHDVVVVGAGLAGMRAAIAAHEAGADVALLTKVHPVRSHSGAAQGGINAALGNETEDSPANHTFDTVKGSDYLGDQDAIEILCEMAPAEIIQLEHWGAVFSRQEGTGKIAQRPFGGAGFPRTCFAADLTGLVILHTLYTVCVKYDIPTYEEWFVTELVKDSYGGCCGVVAYDMVHGTIQAVRAKSVVLATGGAGPRVPALDQLALLDGRRHGPRAGAPASR